jgi:hypothetical protein
MREVWKAWGARDAPRRLPARAAEGSLLVHRMLASRQRCSAPHENRPLGVCSHSHSQAFASTHYWHALKLEVIETGGRSALSAAAGPVPSRLRAGALALPPCASWSRLPRKDGSDSPADQTDWT